MSWGDGEVEFSKKLDQAEQEARQSLTLPLDSEQLPDPIDSDQFLKLVEISPAAAVMESWKLVERELDNLYFVHIENGIHSVDKNIPPFKKIDELLDQNIISGSTFSIIKELRMLRNFAAHTDLVEIQDAYRFRELATEVMALIVRESTKA